MRLRRTSHELCDFPGRQRNHPQSRCRGQISTRTHATLSPQRGEVSKDALSHVLSVIRLTGAVFLEAELKAGWFYVTPPAAKIGALLIPEAEQHHPLSSG